MSTPSERLLRLDRSAPMGLRLATEPTDTAPATVTGPIVPFGERVERFGVTFTFEQGSLQLRGDTSDMKLLVEHDTDRPVGYATDLHETTDELQATFALPDLPQSRNAADEVEHMLRNGFSVGVAMSEEFFDAFTEQMWSMRDQTEPLVFSGELLETSLVSVPQFNSARATHQRRPVVHMTKEEDPMPETPAAVDDVAVQLAGRLDRVEARMLEHTAPRPADPADVPALFTDLVTRYGTDASQRRLQFADMVSGDNTGLTDPARTVREIIDYLDAERYMLNHVSRLPFPDTGIVHTLPVKTQRSQVGQAAEKAPAPSRPVQTGTVQFTGDWYKGWLDISYELIRTSSPGAVAVAVDDMLDQAALESEQTFINTVETWPGITAQPGIDFTSYGDFITSVRAAVRIIRDAAGRGSAPKFGLTPDSWDNLLTFVDTVGRRQLATSGPQNADGSADLTADTLMLAGIMFFESPHSSADVAFNDNSLRASELPPLQLSADNPQLVGRDVAILGNIMAVPRVPAGIVAFTA